MRRDYLHTRVRNLRLEPDPYLQSEIINEAYCAGYSVNDLVTLSGFSHNSVYRRKALYTLPKYALAVVNKFNLPIRHVDLLTKAYRNVARGEFKDLLDMAPTSTYAQLETRYRFYRR